MKILDIALNNLLRSFRSLFALGMMFAAPMLITGLIYFAFGGMASGRGRYDLPTLKVAVVNLDQPVAGQPQFGGMVRAFLQDERMLQWLLVSELPDEAAARAAIEKQQIGAAVIVPSEFSARIVDPQGRADIRILADPTLTVGPGIVQGILDQFLEGINGARVVLATSRAGLAQFNQKLDGKQAALAAQRYTDWYTALQQEQNHGTQPFLDVQPLSGLEQTPNPIGKLIGLIMAGMLVQFAFFTAANAMTSVQREDEEGTLARLFTTPTPRSDVLAGHFLAVLLMVLVQTVLLTLLSTLAFQINWGQPITVVLVIIGQVAASAGLGVFLISLVRNSRQTGLVLGGGLTALGMLGGLFTVAVEMPAAFDTITLFTPQGWAMRAWRLTLSGAAPAEAALPMVVLVFSGLAFFCAGVFIFRKRFA